ncbi:MAG: acylase [bacterium]|nr:acylase [bacterium]
MHKTLNRYGLSRFFIVGFMVLVLSLTFSAAETVSGKASDKGAGKTEILWDNWGVPHIFAGDTEGMFYAFGWAQMQNHGDLILQLYGEARGRAAEYWGGKRSLRSDLHIRTMGAPERAKQWLKAYSPEFQKYLKAFAKGMNDYATKHKTKLNKAKAVVLPVTAEDILAHTQRVLYLHFLGVQSQGAAKRWKNLGSNAWAIAPSRSESGNSMLLCNPHVPWMGFYRWFEAQLSAPGVNAYGITFIGMPMHIMAFNEHLGWTHTVNMHDGADLFELTLEKDGYLLDGKKREFRIETRTVKIKKDDGSFEEQQLKVEHSVHGPVISKKSGKALALKIAGLDRPLIWEQRLDMARATNFEEFKTALKRRQLPFLNVAYADRNGHIMIMHNGLLPKRSKGDWNYWQGIVPGDTSETLWTQYHTYGELPKVIDPPNGWVQNANKPIWGCTYPMVLKPADYANYVTLPINQYGEQSNDAFRDIRSQRLLHEDKKISFQEMIDYKHCTRMELADRLMDDLLLAVKAHGSETAKKAAGVLKAWDRTADAASKGGILFEAWFEEMKGNVFAQQWDAKAPFTTPDGLKDPKAAAAALESAANRIKKDFGAWDVPWGDAYRLKYGDKIFPANGGPGNLGIFRTMYYYLDSYQNKKIGNAFHGDSYTCAVEFSKPVKAMSLMALGNATQPDSKHRYDQLELMSQKKLRPVWLTRKEIEKHLEKKETFPK